MQESKLDSGQLSRKWFINTEWLDENGRSFALLAQARLCPKCLQKLKPKSKPVSNDKFIKAFKDCCSKSPEFIHTRMPVMESVFRVMLANGNKPLALEDIVKQLGEAWGVGVYRVPGATLNSLLQANKFYGLKPSGK